MGEALVDDELRSLGMKRPPAVKLAGVGLWSSSVRVSCPRGRTLPQYVEGADGAGHGKPRIGAR